MADSLGQTREIRIGAGEILQNASEPESGANAHMPGANETKPGANAPESGESKSGAYAEAVCVSGGMGERWLSLYTLMKDALEPERFTHSLDVADASARMGLIYGCDQRKLAIAGLLHDGAKDMSDKALLDIAEPLGMVADPAERTRPNLLHGPVASVLAERDWGISDPAILQAIRYHTTGEAGMSKEACIVFMADLIEPARAYQGVEILRRLCGEDLKAAVIEAIEQTVEYVKRVNKPFHQGMSRFYEWIKDEGSISWKAKI